jgi:DNA mismatch repair protein MutS
MMHHLMPFKIIKHLGHMHIDYRVKKHLEIDTSLVKQ